MAQYLRNEALEVDSFERSFIGNDSFHLFLAFSDPLSKVHKMRLVLFKEFYDCFDGDRQDFLQVARMLFQGAVVAHHASVAVAIFGHFILWVVIANDRELDFPSSRL